MKNSFNSAKNMAKQVLVFGAVFYVQAKIVLFYGGDPKAIIVHMHNWGWTIFFLLLLGFLKLRSHLFGLLANQQYAPRAIAFFKEFCAWPGYALILLTTAAIRPDLASCSAGATIFVWACVFGLAAASAALVIDRDGSNRS